MRDKLLTEKQFIDLLLCAKGTEALRPFAEQLGVQKTYLARVLAGDSSPGLAIPSALGYEPVTMYRRLKTRKNGKGK